MGFGSTRMLDEGAQGGVAVAAPPAGNNSGNSSGTAPEPSSSPAGSALPGANRTPSTLIGTPRSEPRAKGPLGARIKTAAAAKQAATPTGSPTGSPVPTAQPVGSAPPVAAASPVGEPPVEPSAPGQPAAPAPTALTAPTEPAVPTLFDIMREDYGLDFTQKYKTDVDLLNGLAHAAKLVGVRDADAEYGRQMRQHEAQFRDFLMRQAAEGQQLQQQQAPPPEKDPIWDAPQWNPAWRQYLQTVTDPTTGREMVQVAPGTPLQIQQSIDEYRTWKEGFDQTWHTNPKHAVQSLVEKIVEQKLGPQMDQRLDQVRSQQTAQSIIQSNDAWKWQRDEQGQVIRDPLTGQPQTSQRWNNYWRHVQHTTQLTPDPVVAHQMALRLADGDLAIGILQSLGQRQQPVPPAAPVSNGSVPAPVAAQPPSPAIPPGARHRPNSTAGAAPGEPAVPQFPKNWTIGQRIKAMAAMRG